LTAVITTLIAGWPAWAVPQSTFRPAGPVARIQMEMMQLALVFAAIIFVIVGGVLLFTLVRFRARPNAEVPKQIKGSAKIELIWTLIPVVIVIILAVPTVRYAFHFADMADESPIEIKVTGHQWWFEVEYPEHGITTANEVHIPAGQPVYITLASADVIHSFWAPRLAGKVDMVPGRENGIWLQADEPGVYYGQCAEFCGTAHAQMRFRIVAHSPDEFDGWVDSRRLRAVQGPAAPASELAVHGAELFNQRGCIACHAIDGTAWQAAIGPNLTDFGARHTIAAGILDNTPENLARWLRNPQEVKPGNKMPILGLSDDDIEAISAYLYSLR